MWNSKRGLLLAIVLTLVFLQWPPNAFAQPAGTPVATVDRVDGRLGGSLASITARFGEPDFTSDGIVRYDAVDLRGLSTILVVYYDSSETVTRLALVYPGQPAPLVDSVGILPVAALVAPQDGRCEATTIASGFGDRIYPCHSTTLAEIFTASRLAELGVTAGAPGDYSIAIDPLPDGYFELILQPGTDGASLVPTPIPTVAASSEPTASPTPDLAAQYPELTDPAALLDGDIALNEALSFTGEIVTLQVAEFGKQFRLGADKSLGVSSLFQVEIANPGAGDAAVLFAGYNGDATSLAVGDTVTVYGINYGTQCFDNAVGDEVCQPLIAVDMVEEP